MALTSTARVLYGSPLNRPRTARWVVVSLAVLVVISLVAQASVVFRQGLDGARVYAVALLCSGLLTLMPLSILWFLDRRERESGWLYLIAFLGGALISSLAVYPNTFFIAMLTQGVTQWVETSPALQNQLGEAAPMFGPMLASTLGGVFVEECLKGAGLVLLFWLLRAEFDSVRDGFIYGVLIGIGFNCFEAALYVMQGYAAGGSADWMVLASRHALLGFGMHAIWTGLFGLFLGLSRQTTRPWVRYLAPPLGWLLGFLAHATFNQVFSVLSLLTGVTLAMPELPLPQLTEPSFLYVWLLSGSLTKFWGILPFWLIALVMLWRSGVWERRVIRQELADETYPVITPEEYEAVQRDGPFKTRRISHVNRRVSAALVQAQNELAIRKWRIRHRGGVPEADPVVASWRAELQRLRE